MEKRHWKSGPKPRPKSEIRSKRVTVRMTPGEYAEVMTGKPESMSDSTWLYLRAIETELPRPIPQLNREAWSQLGKTAGGLTTLVEAVVDGRIANADPGQLKDLAAQLAQVRNQLLGIE